MGQKEWVPTEVLKLYWLSFSTFIGVFKTKKMLLLLLYGKIQKVFYESKDLHTQD